MARSGPKRISHFICALGLVCICAFSAAGQDTVHGLWVWKTPAALASPSSVTSLRDFCRAQHITEVYLSFSHDAKANEANIDQTLASTIRELHKSGIRVEALLSSTDADQAGKHREKLLGHTQEVLAFNVSHPRSAFDGVHLDVEPQQRPENKGAGNLRFLPDLAETFREVRKLAESARLSLNADIQNKLLKGDIDQRRMLLTSVPRLTLMLYELSSPNDGASTAQKTQKLRSESQRFIGMAYAGIDDADVAKLSIALRTPDYEGLMPEMLETVDRTLGSNPHYLGWAWHSWNDSSESDAAGTP